MAATARQGSDDVISGGAHQDGGWFGYCRSAFEAFDISLRTGIAIADGTDTLGNIEDVNISGGVPTVLEGNWKDNRLRANSDDDHLFGRGGDDYLLASAGDDTNDGGRGRDTCFSPRNGQPGATNCEN